VLLLFPSFDFDFDLYLRPVSSVLLVSKPFLDLLVRLHSSIRAQIFCLSCWLCGRATGSAPVLDFSFANQSSLVGVQS
jgi:hypothetical protein